MPVKSSRSASRWAASRSAARNACGVCTPASEPGGRAEPSRVTTCSTATTGMAPPGSRAAARVRSKRSASASGRAASWTATTPINPPSISSASTRRACHSDACRVSPPVTISTSASPRCGARAAPSASSSPGRATTTTRRTSGIVRAVWTDHATTGRPCSGSSTLLTSAPTRAPAPAASTTTAVSPDWSVMRPQRTGQCSHPRNTPKRVVNTAALASQDTEGSRG